MPHLLLSLTVENGKLDWEKGDGDVLFDVGGGVPAFKVGSNLPIFGCTHNLSSNFLKQNKIGH